MAYQLRVVFIFLNGWEIFLTNNISWHMRITWNPNFCGHKSNVIHVITKSFFPVLDLLPLCHAMLRAALLRQWVGGLHPPFPRTAALFRISSVVTVSRGHQLPPLCPSGHMACPRYPAPCHRCVSQGLGFARETGAALRVTGRQGFRREVELPA